MQQENDERPIEILMDELLTEDEGLLNKIGRYAKFRRFDTGKFGRAYAVLGQGFKEPTLCRGLTGFIDLIPDKGLSQVKMDFAKKHGEGYKNILSDLANFGTFGHIQTAILASQKSISTGYNFRQNLVTFMTDNGMDLHKIDEYYTLQCAYIFSMNCFFSEVNFDLFAVEYPVVDFEKEIATCVDIVGEMDFKGERINATINLKFRMSPSVYEKDEIQSNIERFMLNNLLKSETVHLPCHRQYIDRTFILCPKNITSRTKENYLLKDTTDKYKEDEYLLDYTYFKKKGFLEYCIDKEMPKFKGIYMRFGDNPQYETIRQRMNSMFTEFS
jgi:hypothetical protein